MNRETYRSFITLLNKKRNDSDLKRCAFEGLLCLNSNSYSRLISNSKYNSLTMSIINNLLFPKKINQLLNYQVVLGYNVDEKTLVSLVCFFICNNAIILNRFISLRKQYENFIYREKYKEALELLNQIDREICVSLWSCSQRFFIEETLNGLEGNKRLLDDYLKISKNRSVTNAIVDFMSSLSEKNTSYNTFQNKILKLLGALKIDDLYNYFNFKFNLDYSFEYKDLLSVLKLDFQFSIVDLYESVIDLFSYDVIKEKKYFKDVLNISYCIEDNRLKNMIVINDYKPGLIDFEFNEEFYIIYDMYIQGKYETVIDKINSYFINKQFNFQLLLIFVKSHIYLGKEMDNENILMKSIFNLLSFGEEYNQSVNYLHSYIKYYKFLDWGKHIKSLVYRRIRFQIDDSLLFISHIYDEIPSPSFSKYILDFKKKNNYIIDLNNYCPISSVLFNSFINGKIINTDKIEKNRVHLYNSQIMTQNNQIENAIKYIHENFSHIINTNKYFYEKILRVLFCNYLALLDVSSYIKVGVEAYIINNNLINRLPLAKAVNVLTESDTKGFFKLIEYPIFISITKENERKEIRYAYQNFLDANGVDSVLNIVESSVFNKQYLYYFLSEISTIDVLKKDVYLYDLKMNPIDVRITILKYLAENDISNKKKYENEISDIMKKEEIESRTEQINKSRIFVDVEKIFVELKPWLLENFNMYINVKNFEFSIDGININSDIFIEQISRITQELNERIKTEPLLSQEYIIVYNMIERITEEFLFNPHYGLESFLSSRIRHGYLKDHLVSVFSKYELISKSDDDNSHSYMVNEYVISNIDKNENLDDFLKIFSDFTQKIERKIKEINDSWIRIRYEKNQIGMFDFYNFAQKTQLISLDKMTDCRMFFDSVVEILWAYVKEAIKRIRSKIETELKTFYDEELLLLEMRIDEYKYSNIEFVSKLKQKINLCKSEIPDTIMQFKEVFQIKVDRYKDFSFNDLISTCKQIYGRLYAKFDQIDFNERIDVPIRIKGSYFPYFVDILCILLNNSINHSGYEFDKLNIYISVDQINKDDIDYLIKEINEKSENDNDFDSELIKITVRNNLCNEDVEGIKNRIQSILDNINNTEIIKEYSHKEGGSGLYKMCQKLLYYIPSPYIISYDVIEEYFEISLIIKGDSIISDEVLYENISN